MDFLREIREKTARGKATLAEIQGLVITTGKKKALAESQLTKPAEIAAGYSVILTEEQNHPFCITPTGLKLAQEITKGIRDDWQKAKAIFDWLERNVSYSRHPNKRRGYQTAQEVMEKGTGICSEMAYLYIVLVRAAGLKANWVEVIFDYKGKGVNHACAVIYLNSREVFVDPAYHQFDIKHQEVKILNDQEAVRHFKAVTNS